MREKLNALKESLTETTAMSKKEFLLVTAVCILSGIVFGLLFSPRKNVVIGSMNGNNSANNNENSLERAKRKKEEAATDKERNRQEKK